MNMKHDPEKEDALLQAVLRDENWQRLSAHLKGKALDQFRAQRRQRRFMALAGLVLVLMAIGIYIIITAVVQRERGANISMTEPAQPMPSLKQPFITDDQLLLLFPKGSCVLAEVNGQKELVFLDANVKREYFGKTLGR